MSSSAASRLRFWFFPIVGIILIIIILWSNPAFIREFSRTSTFTYLSNALHGTMGSGYGTVAYIDNPDIDDLLPGDILLGGWTNCAYGRYSHAGIYLGDNQVLEGYADYGITSQSVNHYLRYAFLCILRVDTDDEVKQKAILYAKDHEGEIFHPLAFKPGERYWNCTKIIWKAYFVNGIDIDPLGDIWIAPDAFRESQHVKIIYER